MAKSKTDKAIATAKERLRQAVDSACIARGEAQWMHGWRTGSNNKSSERYARQMELFKACARAEAIVERAIRSYSLVIRRSFNPMKRRKV